MANLVIADISIRQDKEGRYNLNDLHKAAGGEKRHQPTNWLRSDQTKALIAELATPHIRGVKQKQPVSVHPGIPSTGGGTYVCKELVYSYGMWISPVFHLKVIRAYDVWVTGAANPCDCTQLSVEIHALTAAIQGLSNQLTTQATPKLRRPTPKPAAIFPEAPFLTAWWDCLSSRDFTSKDLYRIINSQQCPALLQAAEELFGPVETWTSRRLSHALQTWSRRTTDGFLVLNLGKAKTGITWRLEKTP